MVWWFIIQVVLVGVFAILGFNAFGNAMNAVANLWPVLLIGVAGIVIYLVLSIMREREKSKWEVLKTLLMIKKRRD